MQLMSATTNSSPDQVRLVLIDDHEIARAGLRALLVTEPGFTIVGEASGGIEGVALCRRLQPNVVLMDVRMPDMDGIAATAAILAEQPTTRIIITTMYEDPGYMQRALEVGAVGYVLKDASRPTLVGAVHQALAGGFPLHQELAALVLRRLTADNTAAAEPTHNQLTPRELDVLALLVKGLTNRQIGDRLYISIGTVKLHVERILAKLDVTDRTQAAVRAVELGLVSSTTPD